LMPGRANTAPGSEAEASIAVMAAAPDIAQ